MSVNKKEQFKVADQHVNDRFHSFRVKFISTSATDAAKELGITPSLISMIESGQRSISLKVMDRMIRKYKLNPEWLISGFGYQQREEEYIPDTPKRKASDLSDKVERLLSGERSHDMRYTKLSKQMNELESRIVALEKQLTIKNH